MLSRHCLVLHGLRGEGSSPGAGALCAFCSIDALPTPRPPHHPCCPPPLLPRSSRVRPDERKAPVSDREAERLAEKIVSASAGHSIWWGAPFHGAWRWQPLPSNQVAQLPPLGG